MNDVNSGKNSTNLRCGLVANNKNSFPKDMERFYPHLKIDKVHTFCLLNGDFSESPIKGVPLSFPLLALNKEVKGTFDSLALSGSLILFDTDWHKCLIILAINLLKAGGELIIPMKSAQVPTSSHNIELKRFESWLGLSAHKSQKGNMYFKMDREKSLPHSTISWMAERGPDYLRRILNENTKCESGDFSTLNLRDLGSSFAKNLKDPFETFSISKPKKLDGIVPRSEFSAFEYLCIGAGRKFAPLKMVYDQYLGKPKNLRVLDHGSSLGLIPGQFAFQSEVDLEAITVVEAMNSYQGMAYDFFDYLSPKNRAKFAYEYSFAQDYEYKESYHIIGFIHMFFLVDKAERKTTLAKAMDALTDNGAVVFWEIPKTQASASASYFDKMMTGEEIEEICLPYDVVAYLDTRYLNVIDPSDYIDVPIIRVLKKKR